jgi:hypothetical protein
MHIGMAGMKCAICAGFRAHFMHAVQQCFEQLLDAILHEGPIAIIGYFSKC